MTTKKWVLGWLMIGALLLISQTTAMALDWGFKASRLGRVLDEGGWSQQYELGNISMSPEFTFPVELVYLSSRTNAGPFGQQWFCPQLESTVIPKDEGIFVWQKPSGPVDVFRAIHEGGSLYFDTAHEWLAKVETNSQWIQNQQGWVYEYHMGKLQSVTSPTNRVMQVNWSGNELEGVTIGDGQMPGIAVIKATYTDDGHISTLVLPSGAFQFAYQPGREGRLTEWMAPTKQAFAFTYDRAGVLQGQQDSQTGILQTFTTSNGQLTQDPDQTYTYKDTEVTATTANGQTVSKNVNLARGIVTESTGKGQVRKTYFYRAPGQKYDCKLRLVEENGKTMVQYFYDRKTGLLTSVVDEHGNATHFDYPDHWQPTDENPWDPKPDQVWKGTLDKPELIAQYDYDSAGRIIGTKDKAGQITKFAYDSRNELSSFTNPQGVTATVSYDFMGRPTTTKTGSLEQSVTYDDSGRVTSQKSPTGAISKVEYDASGNVTKVTQDGKVSSEFTRDSFGRVTGVKDALGRVKKIDLDNRGNTVAEWAPDGTCTKYEFDSQNRRTAQIDGNGNKTRFEYDMDDHVIKQTNPLGQTIAWEYNVKGQSTKKITAEQTITSSYNEEGLLASVDFGHGERVINSFDDQGHLLSAVSPDTSVINVYAPDGSVTATRYLEGSYEQLARYRYDNLGRRTGLLLAELQSEPNPQIPTVMTSHYAIYQQTEYSYDAQGHLGTITNCGQPVVTYEYDALGRVAKKTFGNGITSTLSYDTHSRLTSDVFANGPLGAPLTLSYEWDAADEVTKRTWNGQAQRYEYTPANQLSRVLDDTTNAVLESYVYDKGGNMIEKTINGDKTTLTYNTANELISTSSTSEGTKNYTYDKAGRMIISGDGVQTTYGWLDKAVQLSTGAGGQAVTLSYWPDGQLADKITPVGKENYLWDALALLRQGNQVYIAEPHPNGGSVVASHPMDSPNALCFYLNDMLGTTLATANDKKVEMTHLTSFGQLVKFKATKDAPNSVSTMTAPQNPAPQIPVLPAGK